MVGAFRSFAFLGLALSPLLSACGGGETVGEAFGYELAGPDEMAVIKRPPLTLPPDYNLRPPRDGSDAVAANIASEEARQTLIGSASSNGAAAEASGSEGQNLLVSRSNRTKLNLDELTGTRAENRVDSALLRRLLAWNPNDAPQQASDEGDGSVEPKAVVQVVNRSQTVVDTETDADEANAE